MQEHLTNEQLTEYLTDPLASGGDATIREHLAACAACRNEAGRLHSLLALYGEVTRAAGARPQAFWQWQRTTILTGGVEASAAAAGLGRGAGDGGACSD